MLLYLIYCFGQILHLQGWMDITMKRKQVHNVQSLRWPVPEMCELIACGGR